MGLNIGVRRIGMVSVISCDGLIETGTSRQFRDAINGLLKAGQYKIVVDLEKTSFMCSSAWGVVIGSLKEARQGGGDILLADMSEEAKSGFYMANFNEILDSHCTVEDAVKFLS